MQPRWFTWLFVFALGYMIYSTGAQHRAVPVIAPSVPQESLEKSQASIAEFTDVERWKRKLNPEYAAVMNCSVDRPRANHAPPFIVTQESEGAGAGAQCGEKITLQLTVWAANGSELFSGKLTLALGSRELASGLDTGLIGLKPGGVRVLAMPGYAKAHATTKPAQLAIVTLRKLMQGEALVVVRAKRL